MKTIMADELRSTVIEIFTSRGVSERDSGIVADSLVHANLRGTDSHGVMRVPHYTRRLEMGSINPKPSPVVNRTAASTASISGDDGFGHVTAWDAMGLAIELAKESGIGFVGITHSNHCGALSFFAERAIEAGMIGMVFSQTDAAVVPLGGRKPFFGSNPLCIGAPSLSGPPVILDMATSTVAGGHVFKARAENRDIPPTWALDCDGNPTTNPHKAVYWTPAAGAKGYGLGAMVDILTGVLCGGLFGPHIPLMYSDLDQKRGLCHLVAAIDCSRFSGRETFLAQMSQMVKEIHQVECTDGVECVLAPGEPEYRTFLEQSANGIPISDEIWTDLMSVQVLA